MKFDDGGAVLFGEGAYSLFSQTYKLDTEEMLAQLCSYGRRSMALTALRLTGSSGAPQNATLTEPTESRARPSVGRKRSTILFLWKNCR